MDYRKQNFLEKFGDAGGHLGVPTDQVVSLKVRDNVSSYEEYRELLRLLKQEAGIRSAEVVGDLQGNGHLLEHSRTKVLVVEHETGLEILYIAGSVASLVGLIPLIIKCWCIVRAGHNSRRQMPDLQAIEIRRLDANGELIEENVDALTVPWAAPLSVMNTAIFSAAELVDAELQRLKRLVESFDDRLSKIEAVSVRRPKKKGGNRNSKKKRKKK